MMCRTYPAVLLLLLLSLVFPGGGVAADEISGLAHTEQEYSAFWNKRDTWLTLSALAGAGAISLWDEDIHDEAQRHQDEPFESLADGFNLFGHPVAGLALSGSLWGYGTWREDPQLAETGRLALQAVLLSQVSTAALKVGVGRLRADEDGGAWSFRPFSFDLDERDSFPSAHTSNAFALAAVLSRRSDHPYAPWLGYGFAGLVAAARVYDAEHWASDVIAGALIGELSGRLVLRLNERHPDLFFGVFARPEGGGGINVTLSW